MNALIYVSGYLLRKCLIHHTCPTCQLNLATNEINDSSQLFCMFRTFEGISNASGLTLPKETFVKHISLMESKFVEVVNSSIERKNIGSYLCSQLPKLQGDGQCPNFPATYLTRLFVKMRLHYALKFGNRELTSKKKKCRKYIKVQHL